MRPEIESYLRDNGARYTTKALRAQLITAGYDAGEVDAALAETETARAPLFAETRVSRSRFWWSSFALHLAAFGAVTAWVVTRNYLYAPIAAMILALMLLVGLGISGLIGRALLPGRGLTVALLVPLISVVGLSGVCLAAISDSQIRVPPRPGVMDIHIDSPLSFDGSGAAECYLPEGGFSVYGPDLGTLGDMQLSASLSSAGDPNAQPSPARSFRSVYLSISLLARVGTGGEVYYGSPGDLPFELDSSSDGLSGTLTFEGLVPQPVEGPAPSPGDPTGAPISGSVSWTCD